MAQRKSSLALEDQGVDPVKAIGIAVLMNILRAVGKVLGTKLPELKGILGVGQVLVEELYVGGVVSGVELAEEGVHKNGNAPFTH